MAWCGVGVALVSVAWCDGVVWCDGVMVFRCVAWSGVAWLGVVLGGVW